MLQERELAKSSSVTATEAHIQSMEAKMAALEAEIQYYQGLSGHIMPTYDSKR